MWKSWAGAVLLPVLALATSLAAPAAGAQEEVRVMTFNIRYGTARDGENAWPERSDLVTDVIRDFAPTVLGVQEALDFQVDELAEALPGYQVIGVGRDDGVRAGEFSALLVDRSRLRVVDQGTFWFSDAPEVPGSMHWGNRIPRICTWARLEDTRSGLRFHVFNLHWDHQSQESRERAAGLLLERIAGRSGVDEPVLVTGDFNAGEANPAFTALVATDVTGLRDSFRDLHADASDVGTFNGFRGDRSGEKIDAVLASRAWCVLEAAIVRTSRDGRYASDHFPVTAVVATGEACSFSP